MTHDRPPAPRIPTDAQAKTERSDRPESGRDSNGVMFVNPYPRLYDSVSDFVNRLFEVLMNMLKVLGVSCLLASVAWAGSPGDKPMADLRNALTLDAPPQSTAKAPTTYPSPADLIKQMKAREAEKKSLLKVAYFDLDEPIREAPEQFSLFGGMGEGEMLNSLLDRLHQARDDKNIKAVLINLTDPQMKLAQAQEIRDALAEMKKAGKKTFVYADSYDTVGYTLASGASDICMLEGGEVMIPGVGFEAQFLKGLFDKVGVQADFVQIGQYKGAKEPFTRTEASDELRGELNHLSDAMYDQIVTGIATHRNLKADDVKQIIDDTMLTGSAARTRGLVDHLLDQDGLRDLIAGEIGGKIDLVKDYGRDAKPEIDPNNIFSVFAAMMKKPEKTDRATVALIPAEGVIVDGEGQTSLLGGGGGVGSARMRRTLRQVDRDPNVKAVVVRIDSPGGSALASEVMWQALRRVAKDKPVVISVGGMAASGGYYLASAGDTIFADPTAIVGSIGVVGGKFVLKDLFAKIGITDEAFLRGKNAGLFSSNEPWTDGQRKMITAWMQSTYDQFTQRVMTTRKGKIKEIDKVARGRIFLAPEAKDLGMVDQIGGVEAALSYAAGEAKLSPKQYDIRVFPAPRTLGDLLTGNGPDAKSAIQPTMSIATDSILRLLSPSARDALVEQLQMVQLMQNHPVILAMPFTLMEK
jgi:protease-4